MPIAISTLATEWLAMGSGQDEAVGRLLAAGGAVNQDYAERTGLHVATGPAVALLEQRGAHPAIRKLLGTAHRTRLRRHPQRRRGHHGQTDAVLLDGRHPGDLAPGLEGRRALPSRPRHVGELRHAALGAGIPAGQQAIAYAVFAAIGTLGVGIPVGIYFAMGARSEKILAGLKDWMSQHNAVIMSVLCLIIGAKLIGDAIAGLT